MKTNTLNMIPIYVMGKYFEVPEGLTILKGLEYAGFEIVRGCGCRGGICGACATMYRKKDDYHIITGLACQTVIEPDINLVQLPFISAHKALYSVREINTDGLDLVTAYPELMRCMGCNTCTRSCPVNLSVMDYLSATIRKDLKKVVELSIECVMCGLCAARCPAEISPYNIALLVRRLYGVHDLPTSPQLENRLKEIENGKYTAEIAKLKETETDKIKDLFYDLQSKKGDSV